MKDLRLGKFRAMPDLWSYGISFTKDWVRAEGHRFSFWCFKLIKMPEQGATLQSGKNYRGINWSFGFLIKIRFYK